jgi:hypothetical protein
MRHHISYHESLVEVNHHVGHRLALSRKWEAFA